MGESSGGWKRGGWGRMREDGEEDSEEGRMGENEGGWGIVKRGGWGRVREDGG